MYLELNDPQLAVTFDMVVSHLQGRPAMPELVFIREIDPNTLLHFAYRGEGSCLRDYSRGPLAPPAENRGYSASQIKDLLKQPGNHSEKAPDHPVSDHPFWYQRISERNSWFSLPGNVGPGQFSRLLDQFHAEVAPFVCDEHKLTLVERVQQWTDRLAAIVTKGDGFNHWENDDPSGVFGSTEGKAWTSRMLEFSRAQGSLHYISVGDQSLDFSLLSMEPNLSISSKNNPFIFGAKSSINLDGLGIRSDGTFCIVETKAEYDCPELYRATIQALCGALAVYAKREMITHLSRTANGRRPAATSAIIPREGPSMGLYVMVDVKNYRWPEEEGFREAVQLLIDAFPPLREVAYFAVDPRSTAFPSRIPVDKVLRGSDSTK